MENRLTIVFIGEYQFLFRKATWPVNWWHQPSSPRFTLSLQENSGGLFVLSRPFCSIRWNDHRFACSL